MNIRFCGDMDVLFTRSFNESFRRILLFLPVLTLLTGCDGTQGNANNENEAIVVSENEADINLTMPRSIVSRKIETGDYDLTLSVNGSEVAMVRNGESWSGETFVPFGTELEVSLDWSTRDIPLASLSKNYGSAASSNNISISSTDYTYADSDNDQLSNFAELTAEPESDPYDADSPADPEIVDPSDTTAISGVYQAMLENGDVLAVFITENGIYQILDYAGDSFDNYDDCWFTDDEVYSVENLGEGFYSFEDSLALAGGRYFVFRDEGLPEMYLESSFESLNWEISQAYYSDIDTFLDLDEYCWFSTNLL